MGIFEAGELADGSGRPYFVMEYVDGEHITRYSDDRGLDLHARVELFLGACEALQHAHLRGILHRDLKPSNILVTTRDETATIKVIDFGVAKAVSGQRLFERVSRTATGDLIGTIGYMSPEQLRGESDIRSDVYSLGVVLYELCTGRLPVDVKSCSLIEAGERIEHLPPAKASARNRACRGDLDAILSAALAKDSALRYQTAGEMAGDLRRFLNNEPILARSPSLFYLARCFVWRRRRLTALAAILLFVGLVGMVALFRETARARHAEDRWAERVFEALEREFAKLDERVGTLSDRTAIAKAGYADAKELLARRPQEPRYLNLSASAARQASKIANETSNPREAALLADEAVRLRRQAIAAAPLQTALRQALSFDLVQLGDTRFALGELDAMLMCFQESAELFEALAKEVPGTASELQRAWSYQRLAAAHLHAGRIDQAIAFAMDSLVVTEVILKADERNIPAIGCARQTHTYLAVLRTRKGETEQAKLNVAEAVSLAERLYQLQPDNREHVIALLHSLETMADFQGERAMACPVYRRGYDLVLSRLHEDPHNQLLLRYAANYALRRSYCALDDNDPGAATSFAAESLSHTGLLLRQSAFDLWLVSSMYFEARGLFLQLNEPGETEFCEVEIRSLCHQLLSVPECPGEYQRSCAEMLHSIGESEDCELALRLASLASAQAESICH